jgi:hypothetical protein
LGHGAFFLWIVPDASILYEAAQGLGGLSDRAPSVARKA